MIPKALIRAGRLWAFPTMIWSIIVYVYHFIPIHWPPPIPVGLQPERESFLYILYLLLLSLHVATLLGFNRTWDNEKLSGGLMVFGHIGFFLLSLWISLKGITYQYPFYPILNIVDDGHWTDPVLGFVLGGWLLFGLATSFLTERWINQERLLSLVTPAPAMKKFFNNNIAYLVGFILSYFVLVRVDHAEALAASFLGWNGWDNFSLTAMMLKHGAAFSHVALVLMLLAVASIWLIYFLVRLFVQDQRLVALAMIIYTQTGFFNYPHSPSWILFPQMTPLGLSDALISLGQHILPIYQSLRVRQFWSFFMPFIMGVGMTVIFLWGLIGLSDQKNRAVAFMVLGIWGWLSLLPVCLSPSVGHYALAAGPWSIICLIFIQSGISRFNQAVSSLWINIIIGGIVLLSLFSFLTNRIVLVAVHPLSSRYESLLNSYKKQPWIALIKQINRQDPYSKQVAILSPWARFMSWQAKRPLWTGQWTQEERPCVLFVHEPYASQSGFMNNIKNFYQHLPRQEGDLLELYLSPQERCQH